MMMYFLLVYAALKLYIILDIYQQSHYSIKEYLRFFLSNIIFYDACVILCALAGLYSSNTVITILCGIYILLYAFLYLFVKVKLKFSKRILRLCGMLLIFLAAIFFIPYVGAYLYILIEFGCIPILYLDVVLSKVLNRKYIKVAKRKIKNYAGTKIIITGSYGKTSTKLLFQQLLNVYTDSTATPKSFNTPLGISRFLNDTCIDAYSHIILEYGASKPGDISELCEIASADVGVVCEIGFMHMNGFKTIDNVVAEKMKLVDGCHIAILNYDNPYIRNYGCDNEVILSYGFAYGDYTAKNIENGSFDFYYKDSFLMHYDTSLTGKHQILNLLAALSYAHYMQYDLTKLSKAIRLFKVEKNRLELKRIGNRIILDDSFNSNVKGFTEALRELGGFSCRRILITPGIVELGRYEREIYEELAVHIAANTDVVILVGHQECRPLYEKLCPYHMEIYIVRNFKEGYALYSSIVQGLTLSALLIENDLPDLYRRGLGF